MFFLFFFVNKRFKMFRKNLIMLLNKIEYLSITCDLWKNKKNKYFLVITGHFFDRELTYRSVILSFKTFKTRHFAHNIQMTIRDDLLKLGIDKKVVAVTTDNESCMVKSCSNLFIDCIRISCMCHNLNLVVVNTLKLWSKVISIK